MKTVPGRKASTTPTPAAMPEALDLYKLLLDGLAVEGVKPKVRKAPSGGYVSLLIAERNIGYVGKQTRSGIKIEPALTLDDLPKTIKGFGPNKTKSDAFLLGLVTDEPGVKQAVAALKLAAEKAKLVGKAKKAKPSPARSNGEGS